MSNDILLLNVPYVLFSGEWLWGALPALGNARRSPRVSCHLFDFDSSAFRGRKCTDLIRLMRRRFPPYGWILTLIMNKAH